jgi:hypothetical protein
MKQTITFFLIFNFGLLFSQNSKPIPVILFKNEHIIEDAYDIYFINEDTIIKHSGQNLKREDLNDYSIRICYSKDRLLIPKRNDQIEYIHVFLDKRSYRKILKETHFGIENPFKKYYYIDLGVDIILRISKSKRKYCPR